MKASLDGPRRRRTALVVVAPLVSVATLMIGLRVGAGHAVRAASIFVAPAGTPVNAGAPVPLAWQVLTYLEDQGVRETIAIESLTVIARSKGKESRWTGASNADGIAEAVLGIADLAPTDPVEIEVRAAGETEPLAHGVVERTPRSEGAPRTKAVVRPSKRQGPIAIDVVVEGERLVAGFETPMWAHIASGDPSRVTLHLEPEAGLRLGREDAKVGCDGWAKISAIAEGHVTGLRVDASQTRQPGQADDQASVWFGALPVAAGAFFIDVPRFVPAGTPQDVALVAPNPRTVVYAEVDDERGRVYAAALPIVATADAPVPRARFEMPPLASGLHWLVVSGEPRGAERLGGATIARPFLVGGSAGVRPEEECSIGPWLAHHPATGFPRTLALDGMATRGASNRASHRLGLFIGLASLLAAAILEVLLLTAAAREARTDLLLANLDDPENAPGRITSRTPGGGLAIGLFIAILGFALLAILLIVKG